MKKTREQKGITLVALIITIVVLIILAVISISALTGESSIIRQATEVKAQSEIGEKKQGNTLNQIESVLIGKDNPDSGNEYEGIAEPISMFGGTYEMGTESNNTYIDIRPNEERDYVYVFSDATFTNYVKSITINTSNGTNRVREVIKLYPEIGDITIKFVFKNCTFNNCSIIFGGLSGIYTNLDITFENCTFNALTNKGEILRFDYYITGTVNITNCTFNMECTKGNFKVIGISNGSDTTLVVNASNNTLNATIATPYIYDENKGETINDNVYVSSTTPKNICLFDYRYLKGGYSQVNETGTILKGDIAIESRR